MSEMITKAALARRADVSRAAVGGLTKPGKRLAAAVVDGKVDAAHPLVVEWLAEKSGQAAEAAAASQTGQAPAPAQGQPAVLPHGIPKELEDLTLREVAEKYAGIDGFKRHIDSLKALAEFRYRDLKIKQQRGELIEKEQVRRTLLPMIDTAFQRLVSDVPETLAKLIVARVQSGGDDVTAEVVQMLREHNSKVLRNLKEGAAQSAALKNAN